MCKSARFWAFSPVAVESPIGRGPAFRDSIQERVQKLAEVLPRAFREEDFDCDQGRSCREYRKCGEILSEKLKNS